MKVDATYVASIPNSGVALSITHMVKKNQPMIILPDHNKKDYII